jgi:serine/threonine-protein phosphatase 5
MQPKNKDARDKYEMTKKEHRLTLLSAAVLHEEKKIEIDIGDIVCESSYTGPKLDDIDQISPEWITKMMDWMKDGKVLHKKFACMIIMKATEIFEQVDSLVDIEIEELEEITVCGDVHGQFYDLLNIFKLNGNPSEDNPYLFNGDFIDRGSFSVEVILTLLAWKVCYPQHFFMSRGNHEAKQLNKMYGFEGEVKHKYDVKVYDIFSQLFCFLPICHVINKKVMVTHGGLFSKDGITLD